MSSKHHQALRRLKQMLPDEIILDSHTLAKYADDKWFATHQPNAVALPHSSPLARHSFGPTVVDGHRIS